MNQIGQSIKKLSIFQNEHNVNDNNNDNNDNNNDNGTHPPWIIVHVGKIFRRGQKTPTDWLTDRLTDQPTDQPT